MLKLLKSLSLAATVAVMSVQTGTARAETLRDNQTVYNGLIAIQAGKIIQDQCGSIDARLFEAIGFARKLQSAAIEDGYSKQEIEAFVTDKTEKKRVKEFARTYLADKGAVDGDPSSFCAVGMMEIETNTQIGVLLKAK